MLEQRKFILDDKNKLSLDELQEKLKLAGFSLSRGYTTIRGTESTMFIQDMNADAEVKNDGLARLRAMSQKDMEKTQSFEIMGDLISMFKNKMENVGAEGLTPIELMLAKLFVNVSMELDNGKL